MKQKTTPKVEMIICSDCGNSTEQIKAHWGHNSWNKKNPVTNAEFAYVCQQCWDGRAIKTMGLGRI